MIPVYEVLAATYDREYGNATYIRSTTENAVQNTKKRQKLSPHRDFTSALVSSE